MTIKNYWLKIIGGIALLKIAFLIPFFTSFKLYWPSLSFEVLWKNFDGPYFLAVADTWYSPERIADLWAWLDRSAAYFPAHFPLLPFFIDLLKQLSLGLVSLPAAGILVGFIFSLLLVWVWIRLYQALFNRLPHPVLVLVVALFPPRMWVVNNIISPEALFMSLTLLAFLFWQKQRYLLAIIHAILAFWTKSPAFFIFAAFGLWLWIAEHKLSIIQTLKDRRSWLVIIGGLTAFVGLNWFYYLTTGDFWAYFKSGDNMHLFWPILQVFNPNQVWVGSFWLEDIVLLLSLYTLLLLKSWQRFKQSPIWMFSALFLFSLFFVAHRDISRYALPIVPFLILMNAGMIKDGLKTRISLVVYAILVFFYSWSFVAGNHI